MSSAPKRPARRVRSSDQIARPELGGYVERIFTEQEKLGLRGQVFRGDFDRMDFAGADLRGACFRDSAVSACDFRGADLRGAEFIACHLTAVLFEGAVFGDNRFAGTLLAGVAGVDEDRARIEDAGGVFTPECSSSR